MVEKYVNGMLWADILGLWARLKFMTNRFQQRMVKMPTFQYEIEEDVAISGADHSGKKYRCGKQWQVEHDAFGNIIIISVLNFFLSQQNISFPQEITKSSLLWRLSTLPLNSTISKNKTSEISCSTTSTEMSGLMIASINTILTVMAFLVNITKDFCCLYNLFSAWPFFFLIVHFTPLVCLIVYQLTHLFLPYQYINSTWHSTLIWCSYYKKTTRF